MAIAQGSRSFLTFAEESAYGTVPAVAGKVIPIVSESLDQTINTVQSAAIRSDRQVPSVRGGNKMADGSIETEFSPTQWVTFMKHLLMCSITSTTVTATAASDSLAVTRGTYISVAAAARKYLVVQSGTLASNIVTTPPTSTDVNEIIDSGTAKIQYFGAGADTIYKHELIASTARPVGGITIEKAISEGASFEYGVWRGGRINQLNIQAPQEGITSASWQMMFKDIVDFSATPAFASPTTVADDPFAGGLGTILYIDPPGGTGITDYGIVKSFNMSINNNFDGSIYVFGSRFRKDLVEGRREVTGSFEIFFETSAQYLWLSQESLVGLRPTFSNIGQYCSIDIPMTKLSGNSAPKISGQGVISTSFNFQAFNNGSAAYDIKVEFYNKTASY